jgi:hypothetical protein
VKQPKPQIRLPDDEGPNPYDSSTRYEDLPKKPWMQLGWWVSIIALAAGLLIARKLSGG